MEESTNNVFVKVGEENIKKQLNRLVTCLLCELMNTNESELPHVNAQAKLITPAALSSHPAAVSTLWV